MNTSPRNRARKRWLMGVLLALVGYAGGYSAVTWARPTLTAKNSAPAPPSQNVAAPTPELTPEQVVELQVQALSDFRTDRSAIQRVFAFASPANKIATGPLGRFELLILNPPYDALIVPHTWVMGRAIRKEDLATVLVTVSNPQTGVSVFRFYLSRQSGDLDGCWMTDRVHCLLRNWRPDSEQPEVGGEAHHVLARGSIRV